ncbi:MAG TPA: (2Fe-2S)-binding protein [Rhizomicrobium sp.]|jgi:isoquinoline 1-oxidoreductase alpha subunit|nr:(2Fe-2S)-binding protein [Rhizomicrobium sp.]
MDINVNGKNYTVNVPSNTPLLWVLRDVIGLTGTKYGCGVEMCGACTVLLDGQRHHACAVDMVALEGRNVVTIEGLAADKSYPIQKAWQEMQVPQCGYCQPGMMMRVAALLKQTPNPTDAQIDQICNICACGTYQRVRAAIHKAAKG